MKPLGLPPEKVALMQLRSGNPRAAMFTLQEAEKRRNTMSAFKSGLAVMGALETDWFPFAHQLNSATKELTVKVKGLSRDIEALSSKLGPSFLIQWEDFKKDFNKWAEAWWFGAWQRREELLVYRKRFNEFHKTVGAAAAGSKMVTTLFEEKQLDRDAPRPQSEYVPLLKTGLIVLGVIAGAYTVGKVAGVVKG